MRQTLHIDVSPLGGTKGENSFISNRLAGQHGIYIWFDLAIDRI